MHRLVAGSFDAVAEDVPPLLTRQVRDFQASLRHDGIRRVKGSGTLRHDCPVAPNAGAGKDCFVYRLTGRRVVPVGGVVTLNARYRLWVAFTDGHWQLATYDYNLIPAR